MLALCLTVVISNLMVISYAMLKDANDYLRRKGESEYVAQCFRTIQK